MQSEAIEDPASSPISQSEHYAALDALRAAMMVLCVAFHAALTYMVTAGLQRFNDPARSQVFDAVALLLHTFFVQAFFLASGFLGALLYRKRGLAGMAANRLQRILVPFLLAWAVIVPITSLAYLFATTVVSSNDIATGLARAVAGPASWKYTYHLWFLPVLLALYPAGVVGQALLTTLPKRQRDDAFRAARAVLASRWLAAIFAPIVGLGCVPAQLYSDYQGNVFIGLEILAFFGLGWLLYSASDLLRCLGRDWLRNTLIGLAVFPIAAVAKAASLSTAPARADLAFDIYAGLALTVVSSFLTLGVVGIFIRFAARPNDTFAYLRRASYWIYLAHLPLVVAIQGFLVPAPFAAGIKWLLTVAIAMPILLASYHLFVRSTILGEFLNGKARPFAVVEADPAE